MITVQGRIDVSPGRDKKYTVTELLDVEIMINIAAGVMPGFSFQYVERDYFKIVEDVMKVLLTELLSINKEIAKERIHQLIGDKFEQRRNV